MRPGERPLRALIAPFAEALADPLTTEVVVNRCGEYGVEAGGAWTWHEAPGLTFDYLDQIGILAGSMSGQDLDGAHPFCGATLPDGERIQICRPSATEQGIISLTIRKPSAQRRTVDDDDFTGLFAEANAVSYHRTAQDEELIALKAAGDWRAFFRLAVTSRKTIAVTGSTGSGKTTLIKRLALEMPLHERIVTIEDAAEFGDMRQRNRVALFHSSGGQTLAQLTAEDCMKAALRMRPDRICIQEIRGTDAFAFLRVLAAGHPGSITTWHAEEGEEFDALSLMLRQHPAGNTIPDARMRQYMEQHIDIVVWCSRGDDGFSAPYVWLKAEHAA